MSNIESSHSPSQSPWLDDRASKGASGVLFLSEARYKVNTGRNFRGWEFIGHLI